MSGPVLRSCPKLACLAPKSSWPAASICSCPATRVDVRNWRLTRDRQRPRARRGRGRIRAAVAVRSFSAATISASVARRAVVQNREGRPRRAPRCRRRRPRGSRPSRGPCTRWGRSVGSGDEQKQADIEGPEIGGFGAVRSRLETFYGSERGSIIPVIIQTIKIDLGDGPEALSVHQEAFQGVKKKMREVTAWVPIVHWLINKIKNLLGPI